MQSPNIYNIYDKMLKLFEKNNLSFLSGIFFFILSLGLLSKSFLAAFFLFLISILLIPQTFSYLDVEINNQIKRIRVIGINTPEVVDSRNEFECFGKKASEKAKSILLGKKVRLEKDPTQGNTDKYGRLLRYVFLEDGTDFGLFMIKEGYVYEYTYNIPYKYQKQYKQVQKEAEEKNKGLWADNVCITPSQGIKPINSN